MAEQTFKVGDRVHYTHIPGVDYRSGDGTIMHLYDGFCDVVIDATDKVWSIDNVHLTLIDEKPITEWTVVSSNEADRLIELFGTSIEKRVVTQVRINTNAKEI